MMMRKITQNEILKEINERDDLTAIEIIVDHETAQTSSSLIKASIIFNDCFFSSGYEIIGGYTIDLLETIKNNISEDTLLIWFIDNELPEAWRQAYLADNIPTERHDRRVKFHAFDEMNEQFCIDQTLLWDITDYFKGTDHELTRDKCIWRYEIIEWYKSHLI